MRVYVNNVDHANGFVPRTMLFPDDISINDLYKSILEVYESEAVPRWPFLRGIIFDKGDAENYFVATIYDDYIE